MRHLSAHRQEQTPLLLVVIAGVLVLAVDIALIAAHRELVRGSHFVWYHHAAIIDAAVAARRDPVIHLQLEILGRAAPPDDEGVALDDRLRGDFAGHESVRGAPVFRIPLPPGERLAVENAPET